MTYSDMLTDTDAVTITVDDIPDANVLTAPSNEPSVYTNSPAACSADDQHTVRTGIECHLVDDEDITAVIERLRTTGSQASPPLSTTRVYQAAALVGVPVWNPAAKEMFTDKFRDQFTDEWHADTSHSTSVDDDDIRAVIERLCTAEAPIPPPFYKTELYQAAAAVGIPVWQADVKASVTDRVCDHLNYEWHAATFQYRPCVDDGVSTHLNAAADAIHAAITTANDDAAVNAAITDWCEQHGLLEASDTPTYVFAQHAALAFLAKATLYEHQHPRDGPQSHEPTLQGALSQSDSIFDTATAEDTILEKAVQLPSEDELTSLFDARYRVLWAANPAETLGSLYEAVLSNEARKFLGQYRTPPDVATIMHRWASRDADTILDPGLGNAALSTSATPRWTGLHDPNHVVGIDRSPLACLFGHTALQLPLKPHTTLTTDFLTASPDNIAGDIDAVVCNPPYTRANALQSEYYEQINTRLSDAIGRDIPKKSPLNAYFFYQLDAFLDAGDRAVVLTPQRFLNADYGTPLKQHLLDEYNIRALALFDPDESLFETANTTSVITFLEACESDPPGRTTILEIDGTPSPSEVLSVLRGDTADGADLDWGVCTDIQQSELSAEQDWQSLFVDPPVDPSGLPRLSELGDIKRGISTGENDFFCLTEADKQDWGIDKQYLTPLVRSLDHIDGYDIQQCDWQDNRDHGKEAWLLYNVADITGVPADLSRDTQARGENANTSSSSTPNVVDYLHWGLTEHNTLSTRSVLQARACWYRVERREPAPILLSSMSRTRFRAIRNEAGVHHVNNQYGLHLSVDLDETEQKALLSYLNSTIADTFLTQAAHRLESGIDKIEPSDASDIPVLDPRRVSDSTVNRLADAFDELRAAARSATPTDDILRQIDHLVQQALSE